VLFPNAGRRQLTEGVRKFITRRHRYVIDYSVDAAAEEIAILSIHHPARDRTHSDR